MGYVGGVSFVNLFADVLEGVKARGGATSCAIEETEIVEEILDVTSVEGAVYDTVFLFEGFDRDVSFWVDHDKIVGSEFYRFSVVERKVEPASITTHYVNAGKVNVVDEDAARKYRVG